MMDLERLRIFHVVAKSGSVTGAAVQLGLSQPAISRQIGTLEEQLKVSLFHRHARGLVMTEQGERLFEVVKDVFSSLILTEAILSENQQPKGMLRVACTDGFGALWLSPRIEEFLKEFPQINASLVLLRDDQEIDLTVREADMAIRTTPPDHASLITVPFLTLTPKIYASKSYLEKFGIPLTLEDLDHHPLISFNTDINVTSNWLLTMGRAPENPRKPFLIFNSTYGILQMVKSGMGIATLPDYAVKDHPDIVEVLTHVTAEYAPPINWYIVYPELLRHSKRVSVFRNFLLKKVAEDNP